jgi:hypothetical protein
METLNNISIINNSLLLFLMLSFPVVAQKNKDFKPGSEITEQLYNKNYSIPKSILFVFRGDTHSINHYLILEKKLKKEFKRSEIKIGFIYDLLAYGNPPQRELDLIPKPELSFADFETVCELASENMKFWDQHLNKFRKQRFDLRVNLSDQKNNSHLANISIRVNTYYTIATQNKALAKTIYKGIMNQGENFNNTPIKYIPINEKNLEGVIYSRLYYHKSACFTPKVGEILYVEKRIKKATKKHHLKKKSVKEDELNTFLSNLKNFKRRYYGFFNEKQERIIKIDFFDFVTFSEIFENSDWKGHKWTIDGGGTCCWYIEYNLNTKKVINVSTNAPI